MMMSDPYAAHASFVRPAWPMREIWRVVVMIVLIDLIFQAAPGLIIKLLPSDAAVAAYFAATTPFNTLLQFFVFGIPALGFIGLLHVLHRRGFWSLIGDRQAAWRDLKRVTAAVALVLFAIEVLPPWGDILAIAEMRNFGTWALLVPVAVLALLVQVGTEEIFFRGYLQQQFACLSASRWVWMGVPSALFGLVHYWNGFGPADGLIWAIWAALLGLACADLTARSGNLGAAIGLHLANNLFALLLYAVQGWPGSGLALFLFSYEDPETFDNALNTLLSPWAILPILTMSLSVLVMWLAARIAIRR